MGVDRSRKRVGPECRRNIHCLLEEPFCCVGSEGKVRRSGQAQRAGAPDPVSIQQLPRPGDVHAIGVQQGNLHEIQPGLRCTADHLLCSLRRPFSCPDKRVRSELRHIFILLQTSGVSLPIIPACAHLSTGWAMAVMSERAGWVVSIREHWTVTGTLDSTRTAYGTPRGISTPSILSVRMCRVRSGGTTITTSLTGSRSSKYKEMESRACSADVFSTQIAS